MDLEKQIEEIYLINNKENIYQHALSVAKEAERIAKLFNADTTKCRLAGLLHDISAIISPNEMYHLVSERNMHIYLAEEKYPFLLHQRVSRIIASEQLNIQDEDILSAIEYHTTLKEHSSLYDKIIFIADKISWDQNRTPPYLNSVLSALEISLELACYTFIDYQFKNNRLLCPHDWIVEAYQDLQP